MHARMHESTYPVSDEEYLSTIWGPTCDSCDCIIKDVLLPEFYIGDWLVWKDMGAYAASRVCEFNGFSKPIVYPFFRESEWNNFRASTKQLNSCQYKKIIECSLY
ncbi:hypothetical protein HZH68_017072 [Vespula germanica]|uniref:Orn/DAP/Arg decarboxylase 2 C-terminal domain-containing protein n=1 Tax=Vespula germanica TaxID=30212 RepID=A0A834J222_VESGE|nr:hypothetical protein HZH68_017072 [Vespula germanica]